MSARRGSGERGYRQKLDEALKRLDGIRDITDQDAVRRTAEQLRRLHYDVGIEAPEKDFPEMSKADIRREIDRIDDLTIGDLKADERQRRDLGSFLERGEGDERAYLEDLKLKRISLILYHYELLTRLRADDVEAWDTVEELYGED